MKYHILLSWVIYYMRVCYHDMFHKRQNIYHSIKTLSSREEGLGILKHLEYCRFYERYYIFVVTFFWPCHFAKVVILQNW